jgi:hypothetical protein
VTSGSVIAPSEAITGSVAGRKRGEKRQGARSAKDAKKILI